MADLRDAADKLEKYAEKAEHFAQEWTEVPHFLRSLESLVRTREAEIKNVESRLAAVRAELEAEKAKAGTFLANAAAHAEKIQNEAKARYDAASQLLAEAKLERELSGREKTHVEALKLKLEADKKAVEEQKAVLDAKAAKLAEALK